MKRVGRHVFVGTSARQILYGIEFRVQCSSQRFRNGGHGNRKDFTIGGLVIESKTLTSRTGSQFGVIKIEDYSGSAELKLFGQDFVNFIRYGIVGSAIMVTYCYKKGVITIRCIAQLRMSN